MNTLNRSLFFPGQRFLMIGLIVWCSAGLFQSAQAVPASPEPIEVTQPDGTKVKVRLRGDEFFSWHETVEGYTIVKDADGFWKFARPVGGKAEFRAMSGARVGASDPAGLGLKKHELPEAAALRAHVQKGREAIHGKPVEVRRGGTKSSVQSSSSSTNEPASEPPLDEPPPDEPPHPVPVQGVKTVKNLVILACFSNHWDSVNNTVLPAYGAVDTNKFHYLFNQVGYSADGAAGSFRDYYREVSYGKLTIDSTITMWVRLPREESYYGAGAHGGIPGTMAADAVAAAEAAGVDFSQADSDSDGWVDILDVIHSGYGEEADSANHPEWVWSVKGSMSSVVTNDGVKMKLYHTEPALRGNSGTGITRIGVIAHETGHFFGLPDLYDYSPNTDGLGAWCLMAGGSWGGAEGERPTHPSAWAKVFLGFAKTVPVHSKIGFSLPRVEDNAVVGMLRDGMSNDEYFLIENRAKVGFDNSLDINPGLLVYHVDQRNANNDLGTWTHPAVKIEEADGNDSLGIGGGGTQAGDAWTSTSGLAGGWRDQTGNTNTSAMLYQPNPTTNILFAFCRTNDTASYTYNRLNNFSAAGSNMTFNVQSLKTDAPTQFAIPATFTVAWAASSEATKYEIQEGSPTTLTNFSDGAESADDLHDNWYVHGKTKREITTTNHSGSACYNLTSADYGAVQSLVLRKPFKVTINTVISFWLLSHVSAGNGFLKCEISKDGGTNWNTLGTYNGSIDPWSQRSYDYTAINAAGINSGDVCVLRFVMDMENTAGWSAFPRFGYALDDISITGTEIAGYGGWTTLDNNVTSTSYSISGKTAGVYAYRVQPFALGVWQGYGAVGETTVRANQPPVWTVNPITGTEANVGVAYNANLSGMVTDEVNDTATFSKVSGPAWLTVNADGSIAGTPQASDAGMNTFTIRATDLASATADVTLNISVQIPYAQWRLNELAGPTVNDSISSFHGTAQGTLVYGQAGVPGAAAGNSAVNFSGSSTAVSIPALNLASNTVTITAMLKCNGLQGSYDGFVGWSSGGTDFSFGFGNGDNRLTYLRNGSVYNSSSVVVPTNEWTFVALVLTPSSATVYMATNSTVSSYTVSRTDPADPIFTSTGYLANSAYGRFNGTLDEVTFYSQALSAAQITQLATTAFTPVPQVIVSSPAAGAGFTKPATFDVTADITPNGHTISKAQFYNATTLIGEDNTAPYSVNVAGLVNGTYTFSVKAAYDGGNTISSMPITVSVTNAPPVCVADAASTTQNTAVTIPVLANDTDPYSLPLTLQSVTQPARGTAVISGTNVIYTPNNYTYGVDTFTYTAFDGVDATAVGTVTVTTSFPNYPSAYTNAVLAQGPVAYWRLNESSGPTAADVLGGHNGTCNAGLIFGTNGPGAPIFAGLESANTAFQFPSNTSVSVPALNLNTNTVTFVAWVKPKGTQTDRAGIVFDRDGPGNGWGLRFGPANRLGFTWNNGNIYDSTLTVPTDAWTFAALVITPTNAIVYMATNATLAAWTNTTTYVNTTFTNVAHIGKDSGNAARIFNGALDEVAIFNRSLTPAQIADLLTAAQTAQPAVVLTSPANGSSFPSSSNITLSASVTTNGQHTIEKVQFYTNATLLAETAAAPYQFHWAAAPAGSYAVTAKLLYDGGGVLTSSVANITVTNNAPVIGQVAGIINPSGTVVTLNFAGTPGHGYDIQRSTNLLSGFTTIWTTNAPAGGAFEFTDTFGDLGFTPGAAFYRLSWLP